MSFRKVELVAIQCDACGGNGPGHYDAETAERLAERDTFNITRLSTPGRHACVKCRSEIAKGEAKR